LAHLPASFGTVFSIRPDGSGFAVLYNFTPLISGTNTDGTQPFGGLIKACRLVLEQIRLAGIHRHLQQNCGDW
jgi:hypothetical protein